MFIKTKKASNWHQKRPETLNIFQRFYAFFGEFSIVFVDKNVTKGRQGNKLFDVQEP